VKKWVLMSFVVLGGVTWALWPRFYSATTVPEANLEISLTIWPMQSIHSDWHREVSIEYDGARISRRLFEDTGWWRGSNLYVHTSGAYVIHEGQSGCFAFTTEPIEFVGVPNGVCTKRNLVNHGGEQDARFYRDLEYLGHFHETPRDPGGVRIRFSSASQTPEVELPEML